VSTITWRQVAATEIEVRYDNGDVETVDGTHAEAARMAQTAGLSAAGSPLGMVRWTPAPAPRARRGRANPTPTDGAGGSTAHDDAAHHDPGGFDEEADASRGRSARGAGDERRPKRIGPWLSQ
jgi:hypothetical protein